MNRQVSHNVCSRSARMLARQASICIVDSRPEDYRDWQATAESHGLDVSFFATADAALRHARAQNVDLWIVNAELPGLSGYELCGMLRARSSRTAVYLVSDQYSPTAERAALASRATAYCCKPGHVSLLDQWWQCHCKPIHPLPCAT